MSKVALLIRELGLQKVEAISALRKELGIGISDITQAVLMNTPVAERKLFDRLNPAFPKHLLNLIVQLEGLGVVFTVYELLDNQVFDSSSQYYEITASSLQNMIDVREQSLIQQRTLGELQDGV